MENRIQCNKCCKYFDCSPEGAAHLASCRRYNGWSSYETWAVALHLDNDYGSYTYWREVAEEIAEEAGDDPDEAVHLLAERLKDSHEGTAREEVGEASVFGDLLGAALSEVDWDEIAANILAE